MFKTKAMIVVAGLAGTLVSSKQARDVTKAVGRYVAQKGLPAATGWVAHLRQSGGVLATDAGLPVLDLTQGFAAAAARGIVSGPSEGLVGRQMMVRIPATPAAAAPVRVGVITAPTEVIGVNDTNPDGWESVLFQVEAGLDGERGDSGNRWREPTFRQPTYRELETAEGARRWAAVPGPISPPHGTGSVPIANGDHLGVIVPPPIPDPYPLGVEPPVADAPWDEVHLRRGRRFKRPTWTWKQEAAIHRLHNSWRTDEGRAAVHIANDPVGLHDELSRRGRIGAVFAWQRPERTTDGFWTSARSRMSGWLGLGQKNSLLETSEPSPFDDAG